MNERPYVEIIKPESILPVWLSVIHGHIENKVDPRKSRSRRVQQEMINLVTNFISFGGEFSGDRIRIDIHPITVGYNWGKANCFEAAMIDLNDSAREIGISGVTDLNIGTKTHSGRTRINLIGANFKKIDEREIVDTLRVKEYQDYRTLITLYSHLLQLPYQVFTGMTTHVNLAHTGDNQVALTTFSHEQWAWLIQEENGGPHISEVINYRTKPD